MSISLNITKEYILGKLKELSVKYPEFRFGLTGSYANGTQTVDSDIDIVIDGDSTKGEFWDIIESSFPIEVDILWLNLLKEEDQKLDNLLLENDLPINPHSVYKTVIKEVIWV